MTKYENLILDLEILLQHPFIAGCIDHTPSENIEREKTYTSICLFYTSDFHSKLEKIMNEQRVILRPWKKSKKFKDIILILKQAKLPIFAFAQTAKGETIYQSKQHFINDLNAHGVVTSKESEKGVLDCYNLLDKRTQEKIEFEYKENVSLSILYISHFILRSFQTFKSICNTNNYPILEHPFMLFHDKFPGWWDNRNEIIPSFINQGAVRDFNFCQWNDQKETIYDLFVDNLCGYLSSILNSESPDIPIAMIWEKWK